MKTFSIPLILACLVFLASDKLRSQETNQPPQLFDEWGEIGSEDASARLDNVATQILNQPGMVVYLVCYGPEGAGRGSASSVIEIQRDYLVQARGLDPERIVTRNAGRYEDPKQIKTEVSLIRIGASPPESKRYESKPERFTGKYLEYDMTEPGAVSDECGCGPYIGSPKRAALADSLRQELDLIVYVVVKSYHPSVPGTWERIAKNEVSDFRERGITADRIRVIYGGTAGSSGDEHTERSAFIQIWALPKDAPPPEKEATPEMSEQKAYYIDTYNEYSLRNAVNEKQDFNSFADIIRTDPKLNVYIIARPEPETQEESNAGDQEAVDTVSLSAKWKLRLVTEEGIAENRIFVMQMAPDQDRQGDIEVWVAPFGVSLPYDFGSPKYPGSNQMPVVFWL